MKLNIPKQKEINFAWVFETSPFAIGLKRLIGCSLSLEISRISLNKYMLDEIKQKLINPKKELIKISSLNWNENNKDAKTKRFFVHCIGLRAFINEKILSTVLFFFIISDKILLNKSNDAILFFRQKLNSILS